MPRKGTKAGKPALQFLERPVGGSRLQHAPEVRAAVNPREFFSETQTHNSSDLNSWVNPQFDCSAAAAPPKKRGRRKWQTATSLLDRCSQLSRKSSTHKYPALSFHVGLRDQSEHSKNTSTTKGAGSKGKNKARESVCRSKRTASNGGYVDAPKRQTASSRKQNSKTVPEEAASLIRSLNRSKEEAINACRIPSEGASTVVTTMLTTSVCPPPDADTPQTMWDEVNCLSPSPGLFLFTQPCTPSCSGPPHTLVADTPEKDYGVKVTWRRRKGLMTMLKERGHLSESDAQIHC